MSEQQKNTAQNGNRTNPSVKEVIAYLAEKFPLCFSIEGDAKPLKVGLFQDLAEVLVDDEKVSKTLLRQALRTYTMSWRYLACCQANAQRVGLQGEEAGIVEESQAQHAAETLAAAKEAYVARRTEERKAQRKEQRKEFFKQKARAENTKKRTGAAAPKIVYKPKAPATKATAESLAALESKFGKNKK